jgi:hypothetical protein
MIKRTGFFVAASCLLVSGLALAEGESAGTNQKGSMQGGQAHRAAMQECMKSGKAMSDCRQEMMKNHAGAMGKGECPMMKEHEAEPEKSKQES